MFNAMRRLNNAGLHLSFRKLLAMEIRGTLTRQMVDALIEGHRSEIEMPIDFLEAHVLANGDVKNVVAAASVIQKCDETVPWNSLFAIDLADRDALGALVANYAAKHKECPAIKFDDLCRKHWQNKIVNNVQNCDVTTCYERPAP